ncbi:hypothetical protein [Azospirillum sp. B2RO_4]|uniref:hypothetical protein n=1 Tax=Azospirillum sp. B2RO_4 TaxID=3027796 RepID=UPI003DA83B6B
MLTVLALPVQLDGVSWRSGVLLAGTVQGEEGREDGGAGSTLDSWLVVREKPPANSLPPTAPPADAVATRTMVIPKRDEPKGGVAKVDGAETDWRLMPFIAAQASGNGAGQPILLSIAVTAPYGQPNPQHEAITYVLIDNLPAKASLSNGERGADGAWKVQLEGLRDLTMTLPPDISDPVSLHITAVTDHGGGVVARQAVTLAIPLTEAVASAEPPVSDTPPPAQGGSSQTMEQTVAATVPDAEPMGSGSAASPATQDPPQSETVASEAAPDPAPVKSPDREIDAAPEVTVQAVVQESVAAPPIPEPPVTTAALPAAPVVAAPPPPPPPQQQREVAVQRPPKLPSGIPEAALMKRGDDLFAQGDLAGARLYYEMLAATGNAKAAFALGRTHDPLVHERLHVRGLPPDPEQAASWYRRAVAAGSGDAEQQLKKLTDWLAGKSR